MSHDESLRSYSMPVAANDSLQQYKFVQCNSNGQMAVLTASTQAADGILQDDPNATGYVGQIGYAGISKVLVGAAGVNTGDEVMSDTAGAATTQTASNLSNGKCFFGGVQNDIVPMLLKLRNVH